MQRHAARIDCRNSRRSQDYVFLFRVRTNVLEEGRFPGSCFARKKNRLTRMSDQMQRILKLFVICIKLKIQANDL